MSIGWLCSSSWMVGTAERGIRSEKVDTVRWSAGRRDIRGGEEDGIIPVEDVGIGVGYFFSRAHLEEGEART